VQLKILNKYNIGISINKKLLNDIRLKATIIKRSFEFYQFYKNIYIRNESSIYFYIDKHFWMKYFLQMNQISFL